MEATIGFKFVDKARSSKYACGLCATIPLQALRAQCCGAIYCQKCGEVAESSTEEKTAQSPVIRSNPSPSGCFRCKKGDFELTLDSLLQESINKLQIECLIAGCGWVGDYVDATIHISEPHDREDELYDNECHISGPLGREDELYDNECHINEPNDKEDELYDNECHISELHDREDEVYDNEFLVEANTSEHQSSWSEQQPTTHLPAPSDYESTDISRPLMQPETIEGTQQPSSQPATADQTQQSSLLRQPDTMDTTQQPPMSQMKEQKHVATHGNICLRFYKRTHSGEFRDLSTSEKLLYVFGFLIAALWILCALPMITISLWSSIQDVHSGNASFTPSCTEYSVSLLWVVVLAHLIAVPYMMFWFSKGCYKPCRGKRMNRATVSSLCLITILYAVIVAGFAVSVLVYVNKFTSNEVMTQGNKTLEANGSGSGDYNMTSGDSGDCDEEWSGAESGSRSGNASGCGEMRFENVTTRNNGSVKVEKACVESSKAFILAVAFLGLLVVFIVGVSCLLGYECNHNGFCYQKSFYDPTVTVIENEYQNSVV